jgi:hypothetical protein
MSTIWVLTVMQLFTAVDHNPDALFSNPTQVAGAFSTEAKCEAAKDQYILRDAHVTEWAASKGETNGAPQHYYCQQVMLNKVNL